MKTITLFLLAGLILQFFSPFARELFARNVGDEDLNDSDAFFQTVVRRSRPKRDNSKKIEALLQKMTVEEKVGQITQLTIDMVTSGKDQNGRIDHAKLEKAVNQYGVGSILNVNNQALPMPESESGALRKFILNRTKAKL